MNPKIQKLVNIKEPYDFEFKESKKDISLKIDSKLRDKVYSLYFDLTKIDLQ